MVKTGSLRILDDFESEFIPANNENSQKMRTNEDFQDEISHDNQTIFIDKSHKMAENIPKCDENIPIITNKIESSNTFISTYSGGLVIHMADNNEELMRNIGINVEEFQLNCSDKTIMQSVSSTLTEIVLDDIDTNLVNVDTIGFFIAKFRKMFT
jgi:hypothetical protein